MRRLPTRGYHLHNVWTVRLRHELDLDLEALQVLVVDLVAHELLHRHLLPPELANVHDAEAPD